MAHIALAVVFALAAILLFEYLLLRPLFSSPLSRVPGPKLYALTRWRLAYEDWKGTRTRTIHLLHQKYGPVVRVGPDELSFSSSTALRTIYGAGSQFGRTCFYRMFDVYGQQNLFSFHSTREHGDRKRLLSHMYSKSAVLKESTSCMLEEKAGEYLKLIESEPHGISNVFTSLHYYSLDVITTFIYGSYGGTSALKGSKPHQALISDIVHPSRRRLSWFWVHLPAFTKWLYSRQALLGRLVRPVLPMQRPTTYTGIRNFALDSVNRFLHHHRGGKECRDADGRSTAPDNRSMHIAGGLLTRGVPTGAVSTLSQLWKHHESQRADGLTDLQMASECADHFLAGIDTTSDTLMFLIWVLSLPVNLGYQERLRDEVLSIADESLNKHGTPRAEAGDRCVFLNAVTKEALRLYAPLPSSEPRSVDAESVIDGYVVPAHTVVSMSPWTLHRNSEVFKDPLTFNPERWLGPDAAELNRWFWAFSSGGRMCIGMQTSIALGFEDISPGITARVETFWDDRFSRVLVGVSLPLWKKQRLAKVTMLQENTCLIKFDKL
ncbi:Cytochrome P450 [Metarhizium album ARSEF 1941]|uniref:Cytochrome P450 n=1 Tax=Metarhizium album (strain ARSEF 1941) TaxID=1081103 RepID=A0A0B2X032_METAS|nr:Cytochrome P450 [Metarhizium album ARSEF 1941]KHN98445.1 Cytochrome P450 [Metarhizium album ARSEF 1941]